MPVRGRSHSGAGGGRWPAQTCRMIVSGAVLLEAILTGWKASGDAAIWSGDAVIWCSCTSPLHSLTILTPLLHWYLVCLYGIRASRYWCAVGIDLKPVPGAEGGANDLCMCVCVCVCVLAT
jgi:hypothetical protein